MLAAYLLTKSLAYMSPGKNHISYKTQTQDFNKNIDSLSVF